MSHSEAIKIFAINAMISFPFEVVGLGGLKEKIDVNYLLNSIVNFGFWSVLDPEPNMKLLVAFCRVY